MISADPDGAAKFNLDPPFSISMASTPMFRSRCGTWGDGNARDRH
jgi:hypothetical protein